MVALLKSSQISRISINYTGQQNLTFFRPMSFNSLAVLFILNSDMYTEFSYQAEFQRYRGLYLWKQYFTY